MFNEFYQPYPRKRNRPATERAFKKLSQPDRIKAIEGVRREVEYRRKMAIAEEWVPAWAHSATWLNGRYWEDELVLPEKQAEIDRYDPIADDIENLNAAQAEGHSLFANGKPCRIDGGRFIFDNDPEQASRNVAAFLKSGNTINTGLGV